MLDSKNETKNSTLSLILELNVKDDTKAKRVLSLIQKAIEAPLYIEEIYKSGKDGILIFCYGVSELEKKGSRFNST